MVDTEKIEKLRKALGWSQAKAAEQAGLGGGRQQWSNFVNKPDTGMTVATLEKIAKALGVKAKDLLK